MPDAQDAAPVAGTAKLARKWADVVGSITYVPLPGARLHAILLELVESLAAAMVQRPFRSSAGGTVGAAMVRWKFVGAGTLERSVDVLADGLLDLVGTDEPAGQVEHARNLVALLGSLTAGYADALRNRTLEQQEDMKRALLSAIQRAEQVMQTVENRFRELFSSAAIGMAITDLQARFVETNPSLAEILVCQDEELPGRSLHEFLSTDEAQEVHAGFAQIAGGLTDRYRGPAKLVRGDGEHAWVYFAMSLLRDTEGSPEFYVFMVQDISELQLLRGRLGHQLLHDALTGVANRQYFSSTLEGVLGQAKPEASITLFLLNLDAFATISNGIGQHAGDHLLRTVAKRLEDVVADQEALVARIGGDEFALLVQDGPQTPEIPELIDRINLVLGEPEYVDGRGIAVSASIGAIRCLASDMSGAELFRAADVALRGARATGKRQWMVFDPHQDKRARQTQVDAVGLPEAWENGEIEVGYEPVVRLGDRRAVAACGTLHWPGRSAGPIDATELLDLAEQTGLSVQFGPSLLRATGDRLPVLTAAFPGVTEPVLRIRLSYLQSGDADLVAAVTRGLAAGGMPARLLELAFDTTAVRTEFGSATDNLETVADIGVGTALCRFSGGPRELGLLAGSPARSVVLADPFGDGGFAGTAPGSAVHAAAEQLVGSLHQIGALVSVANVRTEPEAGWWAGIGVDTATGPLFGAPSGIEEILDRPTN